MRRYELTDEQWAVIEPLLPSSAKTGRPLTESRTVLSAIYWILCRSAPWRDRPERYDPWRSFYHCLNAWRKDGTTDKLLEALQIRLD